MALAGGDQAGGNHVFDQFLGRPRSVRFSGLHLRCPGSGPTVCREVSFRIKAVRSQLLHQVGGICGCECRAVDGMVFGVHVDYGIHCCKLCSQFLRAGFVEFGESAGVDGLEEPLHAAHANSSVLGAIANCSGRFR